MKNYTHTAFEILDMMYYINVATCDDKMVPWNSIVYWAFDRDLNIFWSSAVDAVHSKNISIHPHVFFTVYDSTTPLGVFRQQGVYIQANARELVDPEEIAYAREITQSRKGKKS